MKLRVLLAAVGASLASASAASAALLGVNFTGGRATNPTSVAGPAGVIPQTNWNNESGATQATGQPLVLSDGSATSGTIAWSSPNTWDTGGTPANENANLMFGYLDNNLTTNSVATITGLPASIAGSGTTPYTVIVYIAGDTAGRGGSISVNGISTGSYVTKGPSTDGLFVQALPGTPGTGAGATPGNYVVIPGVTGTNLEIRAVAESIGSNQRLPFDGFQVSSTPVPEPAGVAVVGLAGVGLLARRRRSKEQPKVE